MVQKSQYDKKSRDVNLKVGDHIMVLMPAEAKEEKTKLARPFHGPFRVLTVTPTNAEVRLVDDPKAAPIFVALDRVRQCYLEQGDVTWTSKSKRRAKACFKKSNSNLTPPNLHVCTGPVTRSMTRVNAKRTIETDSCLSSICKCSPSQFSCALMVVYALSKH